MSEFRYAESDGGIQLIPGYRHKCAAAPMGEWNLWGKLREVVVGLPEGTIFPKYDPLFEGGVSPELLQLTREHSGKPLRDVLPALYNALEEESRLLAKIYESHGVKVLFPRPMREEEIAYSFGAGAEAIFSCDVFWCVGRNVMESSWRKMVARPMRWAVRELYQPYVDADPALRLHACPMPSPGQEDYLFECSDILIVGDGNVILGSDTEHQSSNPRGLEWARRILEDDGFKVTVAPVVHTGITHLYAVICIIGPGVAIACEDSFPARRLPEPLKDWDVVWCNLEEARATAPCAVNLDRKTVLLPRGLPRVCEAVSKLGFNVIDVEVKAHAMVGGGIRCMTGVIHREID